MWENRVYCENAVGDPGGDDRTTAAAAAAAKPP